MAPVKAGKYEFRPDSLVQVRERVGLSQAKMANLLGVPANTLSRWETGATSPDAESLAAIYSAAAEHGIAPDFFQRRRPMPKQGKGPSRLLVMWDFQNLAVRENQVAPLNSWLRGDMDRRFPGTSYRRFKAFSHPQQEAAADKLQELGWRVFEDDADMDEEIVNQSKSDCGQEPKDTILVLITKDRDFRELAAELKRKGVTVYLVTPSQGYSQALVKALGNNNRWIKLPSN